MARVVPMDVDNDDAVVGDDDDVDDVVMVMRMFLLMMIQLGVFWCRGSVEIGGAGCPRGCGRCNLEEKLAPSRREEPDRYLEKGDDDDDEDGEDDGADGDAVVGDDDDNSDVDDQYGDKEEAAPYLEGGGCPTAGNQPRNQVCGLAEREHLETDSEVEKLEIRNPRCKSTTK